MKTLLATVLIIGLVNSSLSIVLAQVNPMERETLRGLKGVYIEVEDLQKNAVEGGLSRGQLKTDVEVALRKSGIHVYGNFDEFISDPNSSALNLNVNTFYTGSLYAFRIDLQLVQGVILSRNKTISSGAATWAKGIVGMATKETLQDIRRVVKDLVNQFINDFRAVNPK